jgi:4-amino-4-deoxy-L-arabinose transferase-like glycosyltransferase
MPDIGLLQGRAPKPRIASPIDVPVQDSEGVTAPGVFAREVAAPFLAPVDRAISVATAVVSEPLLDDSTPVADATAVAVTAPMSVFTPEIVIAPAIVTAPRIVAASEAAATPVTPPIPVPPVPAAPMKLADALPIRASDLLWLALAFAILVGTGLGIRDPWPADEPRFAALARDMALSHEWLFPRVGGDLYQDKPPLFFWLLAICYSLFGSLKGWFLIPSFLAAGGTLFLIYDFGRRTVSREAGVAAALISVCTLQFISVARGAQIDATLCFLTTFSMYALLRHLLLGPAWRWYFIGGFAAGLGVFTKGVGFLPLLLLIPYFVLRGFAWKGLAAVDAGRGGWRWWLAPLAMLFAISLWFVPMLLTVAASGSDEYAAYRDEILFKQTVGRYAAAWHHVKGWYYFIVEVIPLLWLPWSLLLFWLVPRFKAAFHERNAHVWLPLSWALIVLVFFSLSPGKRGIYILPALPALAFAAMPFLESLLARAGVRRAGFVLGGAFFLGAAVLVVAFLANAGFAVKAIEAAALGGITALYLYLVLCGAGLAFAAWRAPLAAWPVALGSLAIVFSWFIAPAMNGQRSGRDFVHHALAQVNPKEQLALVAYKEQFLLYLDRATVNFGHRRWLEGPQESYDAALWLNAAPDRVLLVPDSTLKKYPCFLVSLSPVGVTSREEWFLVRAPAERSCAEQGDSSRAISYAARVR